MSKGKPTPAAPQNVKARRVRGPVIEAHVIALEVDAGLLDDGTLAQILRFATPNAGTIAIVLPMDASESLSEAIAMGREKALVAHAASGNGSDGLIVVEKKLHVPKS